jgi:hypothetical protein
MQVNNTCILHVHVSVLCVGVQVVKFSQIINKNINCLFLIVKNIVTF